MSDPGIANTPEPPYYAVLFTTRHASDTAGYGAMAEAMQGLARSQPGYLGVESVRDETGLGITVSYWASEEAIRNWKLLADHLAAQRMGRERWYADYVLRVARVERAYTLASSAAVGLGPVV